MGYAKRKDNKGRILRTGEYQKKDGRYEYRYTDIHGCRKSVYSWKLTDTDKSPIDGACVSIRTMEKEIIASISNGVESSLSSSKTLNEMVDEYLESRTDLRYSTKATYRYAFNKYVRGGLGRKEIKSIKYSDILSLYASISSGVHGNRHAVLTLQNIMCPAFRVAVRDNIIRSDPTQGALRDAGVRFAYSGRREALTEREQSRFLSFVRDSDDYKQWYNLFVFMIGTGCRVGEVAGLTWSDCDMDKNEIRILRAIQYVDSGDGNGLSYHMSKTKTDAGIRTIPMLPDVRDALIRERDKHKVCKREIGGVTDFVFLNRRGDIVSRQNLDRLIQRIIKDANSDAATESSGDSTLLPRFSAHTLRHTFCTRMFEMDVNPKIIQEVMGHSNIGVTMDIYTSVTPKKKQDEFQKMSGMSIVK